MKAGDRIVKRGLGFKGKIVKADQSWVTVEWDDGIAKGRPQMCHIKELEIEKAPTP